MQPHKPVHRRAKTKQVLTRLFADQGWLFGWPLRVEGGVLFWQVVPPPGRGKPHQVRIDNAQIRRSLASFTKTTGQYRKAFERAVSYPARWQQWVPQQLELAADCLRQGSVPHGAHPWRNVFFTRPALLQAAIPRAHRVDTTDPLALQVLAWTAELAAAQHPCADAPLDRWLFRDPMHPHSVVDTLERRLKHHNGDPLDPVPPALKREHWQHFIDTLWTMPRKVRAECATLLPIALPDASVTDWAEFWREIRGIHRRLRKLARSQPSQPGIHEQRMALIERLKPLRPGPRRVDGKLALQSVLTLGQARVAHLVGPAAAACAAPDRGAWLCGTWSVVAQRDLPALKKLLPAIAVDTQRHRFLRDLWHGRRATIDPYPPVFDLTDDLRGGDALRAWQDLVEVSTARKQASRRTLDLVVETHLHTRSLTEARIVLGALQQAKLLHHDELLPWHLKHVLRLTVDPIAVVAVCKHITTGEYEPWEPISTRFSRQLDDLLPYLTRKQLHTLRSYVQRVSKRSDLPAPPALRHAPLLSAFARYPDRLHAPLRALTAHTADPVSEARSILDRDFPPPEALQRQIEALRARGGAKAEARIATLEDRLAHPRPVGAGRLDNLAAKLWRRVHEARIHSWIKLLHRKTSEGIAPEWQRHLNPDDPREGRILGGLKQLAGHHQQLALRVLDHYADGHQTPADWPENAAFLDRMEQLGVATDPWLRPPKQTVSHEDGPITLGVAHDPKLIFWMGAPFGTCLSPGDINFFSTISNAADINKQVLFAFQKDRIVGRCLLALTDQGGLLTFHPYGPQHLTPLIKEWVQAFSDILGAPPVPNGHVSELVSKSWYDDGAIDIVGRFAFRRSDHPFTQGWPYESDEAWRAALDDALAPYSLTPSLLPLVVNHQGFNQHPERIVSLLPWIERSDVLTRCRAAECLVKLGDEDRAWSLVRADLPARLRGELRYSWVGQALPMLWAKRAPVQVHRLCKRIHAQGHSHDVLRKVWAAALEELGRPMQAKRVRENR